MFPLGRIIQLDIFESTPIVSHFKIDVAAMHVRLRTCLHSTKLFERHKPFGYRKRRHP